ncbi:ABC transporter ATP-binding protein [Pseudorhodoplanes sinuspersici]|uniref:ABC transporter ATP-binding protein n=1 Tax=Pseudorhodoplanes sinuspersici TaxID=1235591 RepID=A0A1W6ZZ56_9HYPH|nr:ABC transporter ATP-binding protein [Pseudorhodoplanes sinuspersici]ARQ02636.1 ABC transporter ATP-binding protein [Pseudorhodoplanes sinuspersici]RKE74503.1 amino acid/amide ABC transporter ATP-binding protein 1 (HAAT family) [Pseudorhodoplanes sinuspersici]
MSCDLLVCNDLTMTFGGLTALDALDFAIARDEIVGLVGPNGSGKTTFFNVLTGLYQPSAGAVSFDGVDLFAKPPQKIAAAGIARTFQRSRLMLDQTVFDNVMVGTLRKLNLGFAANILRRGAWRRELDSMIDRVGALVRRFNPAIANRLFEPVGTFTMIDRRRIEICRALIGEPRLLLLDEPSAGMTHEETYKLMDDVVAMRDLMSDLAIVLVEHEMNVIRRVSDRCVVLNFGRKIYEGDFDGLIADPKVQAAYLGQAA